MTQAILLAVASTSMGTAPFVHGMPRLDTRFHNGLLQKATLLQDGHAAGMALGPLVSGSKGILLVGMGGSGAAGRLVADAYHEQLSIPLLAAQDDRLPGCVDATWTVFALSYSGETEETLEAVRQAQAVGARIIAVTSGGTLAARTKDVIREPVGFPPRMALGFTWMAVLGALESGRLIPPVPMDDVLDAVGEMDILCGPGALENPAEELAAALHGLVPCIYATPRLAGVAAFMGAMLNENAKRIAFTARLPESNHNDLVGWSGDRHRQGLAAVMLSDEAPHGAMACRIGFMRERYAEWNVPWSEPEFAHRESDTATVTQARILHWAEYVSLYLAAMEGVDPSEIAVIDALKQRLRASPREMSALAPAR